MDNTNQNAGGQNGGGQVHNPFAGMFSGQGTTGNSNPFAQSATSGQSTGGQNFTLPNQPVNAPEPTAMPMPAAPTTSSDPAPFVAPAPQAPVVETPTPAPQSVPTPTPEVPTFTPQTPVATEVSPPVESAPVFAAPQPLTPAPTPVVAPAPAPQPAVAEAPDLTPTEQAPAPVAADEEDNTPANFQLGTKFTGPINVPVPPHTLNFDEQAFMRQLASSISLSKPEKKRIIDSIPKLKQGQIDELIRIFNDEQKKFAALSKKHLPQLEKLAQQHYFDWLSIEDDYASKDRQSKEEDEAEAIRKKLGL